jgi:hypothetical protein
MPVLSIDALPDARITGKICALAAEVQREAESWAARYGKLIEFEYIAPITLAFAFSSPWSTAEQLRLHTRIELWVFVLDKAIDCDARSRDEVEDIVRRCRGVIDGAPPDPSDLLATALADIIADLRSATLWQPLEALWKWLTCRTLDGMLLEWITAESVLNGATPPTLDEYLSNSDSCAFRLIRLTEWISTGDVALLPHVETLMSAAWHAEISSRLTNDLRTHEREKGQTDLNALMLGVSEREITTRIRQATERCADMLRPLASNSVYPAISLERVLSFGNGFYETTDFRPPVHQKPAAEEAP